MQAMEELAIFMVSLCIQMVIDKMQSCWLSVTYACPYHNPTPTIGHSVHNVDIGPPLTQTGPKILNQIAKCDHPKTIPYVSLVPTPKGLDF